MSKEAERFQRIDEFIKSELEPEVSRSGNRFEIREANSVTVVRFLDRKLLNQEQINEIDEQLEKFFGEKEKPNVVLDSQHVDHASSAFLSVPIRLARLVQSRDGRLVMAGVNRQIREVFTTTRLDRVIRIYSTAEEAATEGFLK